MRKLNYWIVAGLPSTNRIDVDLLISRICLFYKMSKSQFFEKSRIRKFVDARGVVSYLLHRHYKYTSIEVGQILGKDHATVLHACNRVSGFMDIDKNYEKLVNSFL